jgi:hypothetical protein
MDSPQHGEPIYDRDGHTYEDVERVIKDNGDGTFLVEGTSGEECTVEDYDSEGWIKVATIPERLPVGPQ